MVDLSGNVFHEEISEMTNGQTKLIAAAIVFGLGAVALGVGILAVAGPHGEDAGPIPGVIC
jgi:hypothetical protein